MESLVDFLPITEAEINTWLIIGFSLLLVLAVICLILREIQVWRAEKQEGNDPS